LDKAKSPRNALVQFNTRLHKNINSISELHANGAQAHVEAGDARHLPLADETVDLVVTSPPYANAIDYMRAHKFSLVWFGERIADLSGLRATYIGSERLGQQDLAPLPVRAQGIVAQLEKIDAKRAAILHKYLCEMGEVLGEMHRVLRPDCAAVVVVGTSTMRGIDVQTHLCLADIGAQKGFDVVGVPERKLDRNKRMMPARFGHKTDSMIEQRMHEEYVIGLFKPSGN
jgi:DNA modification methylase